MNVFIQLHLDISGPLARQGNYRPTRHPIEYTQGSRSSRRLLTIHHESLTWGVDPGLGAGPAHGVHLLPTNVLALDHDGGRQRGVTKPPAHRIMT